MMNSFTVESRKRSEFIPITHLVEKAIRQSGVRQGICIVFTPHTTAALTINENADPDVVTDMLNFFSRAVPPRADDLHREGNSDAHIKSSLVGCSLHLIIEEGLPVLGTWQGIYFCEFDGPRKRTVYVKVVESA